MHEVTSPNRLKGRGDAAAATQSAAPSAIRQPSPPVLWGDLLIGRVASLPEAEGAVS